MTIQNPTVTLSTAATTTSYAQIIAAAVADTPRVYLRVENLDGTNNLILAQGEASSEVAIATILPGEVQEFKIEGKLNLVPQGRIAVKSSASTPAYAHRSAVLRKSLLR